MSDFEAKEQVGLLDSMQQGPSPLRKNLRRAPKVSQKNQEALKIQIDRTQTQLNAAKKEMVDRTSEFKKRIEDLHNAVREKDRVLRETCTDFERQILKWEEDEKADQEEVGYE